MEQVLLYFTLKYKGNWDKIYDALDKKERVNQADLDAVSAKIVGCKYLTILDVAYPNNLRQGYRPPFVIFYKGDINLIYKNYDIVGVLGDMTAEQKRVFEGTEFIIATTRNINGGDIRVSRAPIRDIVLGSEKLLVSLYYDKIDVLNERQNKTNLLLSGLAKTLIFVDKYTWAHYDVIKTALISRTAMYTTIQQELGDDFGGNELIKVDSIKEAIDLI
jgi:hypothetical protein